MARRATTLLLLLSGALCAQARERPLPKLLRPRPAEPTHARPETAVSQKAVRSRCSSADASAVLQRLRGGDMPDFTSAPPFVLVVALLSSMDSMLLGYDIGCISGIIPFVQAEFGLTNQVETFASAMNSFAVIGALVSGWIADRVGRKPALFMSSCTFAVGSVMMAMAGSYETLVYSRYIQGFGVGAGMLVSPMFIAEVSPAKFRGALVSLGEVSLSLGILLAYCINYFLSGVPNQWRWMIGLGAAPDVLLALRQLFLPESPRFLLSKGKREKATRIQRRIMRPMTDAEANPFHSEQSPYHSEPEPHHSEP